MSELQISSDYWKVNKRKLWVALEVTTAIQAKGDWSPWMLDHTLQNKVLRLETLSMFKISVFALCNVCPEFMKCFKLCACNHKFCLISSRVVASNPILGGSNNDLPEGQIDYPSSGKPLLSLLFLSATFRFGLATLNGFLSWRSALYWS